MDCPGTWVCLITLPAMPSVGFRGGEDRHGLREAQGTAGTHLTPVLGMMGSVELSCGFPKIPGAIRLELGEKPH